MIQANRLENLALPTYERPRPRQVPPLKGHFVNRDAELAELDARAAAAVSGQGPRIVLLSGLGGIGKTELLSRWADGEHLPWFPQGQLYVDLEDVRHDGAANVSLRGTPSHLSEGLLIRTGRRDVHVTFRPAP